MATISEYDSQHGFIKDFKATHSQTKAIGTLWGTLPDRIKAQILGQMLSNATVEGKSDFLNYCNLKKNKGGKNNERRSI